MCQDSTKSLAQIQSRMRNLKINQVLLKIDSLASRGNKSKVTKPIQNKQTALAGERSRIENPHKQTRKYNKQSDEEEEEGRTIYTQRADQ